MKNNFQIDSLRRETYSKGAILLVDADPAWRDAVAARLMKIGYECVVATYVDDAMNQLNSRDFELMICDYDVPGNQDGWLIKNIPVARKGIRVIVTTEFPSVQSAAEVIPLEVAAYLVKPLDDCEFLGHVQRSIEQCRNARFLMSSVSHMVELARNLEQLKPMMEATRSETRLRRLSARANDYFKDITKTVLRLSPLEDYRSAYEDSDVYVNAVREAICVLKKTKQAFKSKDLARLRRNLENLVEVES